MVDFGSYCKGSEQGELRSSHGQAELVRGTSPWHLWIGATQRMEELASIYDLASGFFDAVIRKKGISRSIRWTSMLSKPRALSCSIYKDGPRNEWKKRSIGIVE